MVVVKTPALLVVDGHAGLRKALNMWWPHLRLHDFEVNGNKAFAYTNPRTPRDWLAPAMARVGGTVGVAVQVEIRGVVCGLLRRY